MPWTITERSQITDRCDLVNLLCLFNTQHATNALELHTLDLKS